MTSLNGHNNQKMELIKIKYRYTLTFVDLAYYYAGLTNKDSKASKYIGKLSSLK